MTELSPDKDAAMETDKRNPFRPPGDEERARTLISALWSVQGRLWPKSPTISPARGVLAFIKRAIEPDVSTLVTDEYGAYNVMRRIMDHCVIQHSQRYVDGELHTNTIEGVWSLLKRAWYGSHHHYTRRYTPLYVAEAC